MDKDGHTGSDMKAKYKVYNLILPYYDTLYKNVVQLVVTHNVLKP